MQRRRFLTAIAGSAAAAVVGPSWGMQNRFSAPRSFDFEHLPAGTSSAAVMRVTPDDGFYVHTYYDVCPFSPSERYLAATRLPYQDRIPVLGDTADVCVIDLQERTIRTVYTTRSWGFQTGSMAQWGASDDLLYTNDVVDGRAMCVRIDLGSETTTAFGGPLYHIAPDGSAVIGFPLELLDVTQTGYGVPAKDPDHPKSLPPGASKSEGLWKTDLAKNRTSLLVRIADLARMVPEPPPEKEGTYYFWHSKFNRQGTRIMQILRCLFPSGRGGLNTMVFTFDVEGGDIRYAPGFPVWGALGGHPNWHPDGEHLIRVLRVDGSTPRLCQFRYDDPQFTVLSEKILGGGHPSFERTGRYITTDHFHGSNPQRVTIQLIDMQAEEIEPICVLPTLPRDTAIAYQPHRLDGHPVWSRDYRKICFQAAPAGRRQLYIADVGRLLG